MTIKELVQKHANGSYIKKVEMRNTSEAGLMYFLEYEDHVASIPAPDAPTTGSPEVDQSEVTADTIEFAGLTEETAGYLQLPLGVTPEQFDSSLTINFFIEELEPEEEFTESPTPEDI